MQVNAKKILILTAIACVALVALMLLLTLFDVIPLFDDDEKAKTLNCVFFSLLIIAVSSSVLIAPIDLLKRTKVLPFINIGLTVLAAVLFLIAVWTEGSIFFGEEDGEGGLLRFTVALAIVAVTFTLICSRVQKLGKYMFVVQLVVYALLAVAAVFLILLLYGVIENLDGNLLKFFIADLVIGFAGLIALAVLAKRNPNPIPELPQRKNSVAPTQPIYPQPPYAPQVNAPQQPYSQPQPYPQQVGNDEQYVTIKRSEYDGMKRYIAALEDELQRRRQG